MKEEKANVSNRDLHQQIRLSLLEQIGSGSSRFSEGRQSDPATDGRRFTHEESKLTR